MRASTRLTTLTRVGFATRGLLYLVIAFLILGTGRAEDPSGALRYLGEGGGRLLLGVMATGLVGYGIWRLADAAFDLERHGSDRKGAGERLGAGVSGIVHLFLAWQAIRLIQGVASATGGGGAQDGAATALRLPGGFAVVLLGGGVLLGLGGVQLVKAVKGSFLRYLEPQVARAAWVQWSGRAGYAARGLVFLISGLFLLRAGWDQQSSEAGGMAEVLSWLTSPWDIVVALGLFGFGLFSLVEARFRTLHDVPVDGLVARVTSFR
ncbi:protein of unknown function [Sphingomonas guangdongensis]|uniref:DUF1206 domain-containing protein n=1 Tax=Sphingomonas guangdongensis TaxID=1141890 RepID=A0A285QY27_9SPHN|nr:DUF1206 domain-containing protein [Sphingomonas guangdongensis]SOB86464.1 protein of unknown function [Sphingomonas guangdongensis]